MVLSDKRDATDNVSGIRRDKQNISWMSNSLQKNKDEPCSMRSGYLQPVAEYERYSLKL